MTIRGHDIGMPKPIRFISDEVDQKSRKIYPLDIIGKKINNRIIIPIKDHVAPGRKTFVQPDFTSIKTISIAEIMFGAPPLVFDDFLPAHFSGKAEIPSYLVLPKHLYKGDVLQVELEFPVLANFFFTYEKLKILGTSRQLDLIRPILDGFLHGPLEVFSNDAFKSLKNIVQTGIDGKPRKLGEFVEFIPLESGHYVEIKDVKIANLRNGLFAVIEGKDVLGYVETSKFAFIEKMSDPLRQALYRSIRAALSQITPFKKFSAEELKDLASRYGTVTYKKGYCLTKQGQCGDYVYIVIEGDIEVSILDNNKEKTFISSGQGQPVGEISVLRGIPCTGTTKVASETAIFVKMSKEKFEEHLTEDPRFVSTISHIAYERRGNK